MRWELNESQSKFLQSNAKNLCFWGGRGCGKSLALVLKIINLLLEYPFNYGLLGRYNYTDLQATTEKDFFDICPPEYIRHRNKHDRWVEFHNGSRLMFRGLKDIKKTEVRSLNLGFAALEQAEEIGEELVDDLAACLRKVLKDRDGNLGIQQMIVLCNPSFNWIYRRFVQEKNPVEQYELVRGSMFDNVKNLPESFVQEMTSKPMSWQKVFVYGELDEAVLSERRVIPFDYLLKQAENIAKPVRKLDDIDIFKERQPHIYQIGIDVSEGGEDFSVLKAVDTFTGEEVASWIGKANPEIVANKAVRLADYLFKPRIVLEINGIGMSTLTRFKDLNYENMFIREEYDQRAKVYTKKLGWRTTHQSKNLLVGHFISLLSITDKEGNEREPFAKIRDEKCVEEMKTFLYSENPTHRGMGAEKGFHDDRLMATMLAFWEVEREGAKNFNEPLILRPREVRREDEPPRLHLVEFINNPKTKSWLEV